MRDQRRLRGAPLEVPSWRLLVTGQETVSLSRLGPPAAVVAVGRSRLVPVVSDTVTSVVLHVSQFAVGANDGVATSAPLTVTSIGRLAVVPLAKRIATVA